MDERLRALERRAAGDPALEAERLQELLRAGWLTRQQVELAALLGHGPARAVLGDAGPVGWSYRKTDDLLVSPPLVAWVKALEARHREAPGRAALAAARLAVSLWSGPVCEDPQLHGLVDDPDVSAAVSSFRASRTLWARRFGALLDAVEGWLEAPGKPRAGTVRAVFPFPRPGEDHDPGWDLFVPMAVRSASEWTLRSSPWKAATGAASWGITHAAGALVARHARDIPREAWERVLGHVRDALLPWALRPAQTKARAVRAVRRGTARGRLFIETSDRQLVERVDWTPLPAEPPVHDGRWWLRPETLEDLRQPGALAGAAGLRLTGLQAGDEELEPVASVAELRWLCLRDLRRVSDVGLSRLAALRRLEALDLWGCAGVTGRGLAGGFSALRELTLARTSPGREGLAAVRALVGLERLDLSGCEGLEELGALRGLVALRALDLSGSAGLGDGALAGLGGLTRLESLDLSKLPVTDVGLANLAGLTSLRELRLRGCAVRGRGLSQFASSLRTLVLVGCPVRPKETVEALERLPGVEQLDLRDASPTLVKLARARLARPGRALRLESLS